MKEFILNLISKLEAATSDPVVKLFVISVTVLIIVAIFSIVINMLRRLFMAIFGRKRNKKTNDKRENNKKVETISEQINENVEADTHLQDTQELIDTLKEIKDPSASEPPTIPEPISMPTNLVSYTKEMFDGFEYQPTTEDNEKIVLSLAGKSLNELEQLLNEIEVNIKSAEITIEAGKKEYFALVEQHQSIANSVVISVEAYNQEVSSAIQTLDEHKNIRADFYRKLKLSEKELSELIVSENEISASLQHVKSCISAKLADTQQELEEFKAIDCNCSAIINKSINCLPTYKLQADDNIDSLNKNAATVSLFVDNITKNYRDLALDKLTIKALTLAIERLKEENQRIAEQKAKDEAEARAKEEAEKKAKEEAAAKAEAEKKAREEAERQAAEEAAKAKALEEERLAAEKAELLRRENDSKLRENSLSEISPQEQPQIDQGSSEDCTHVLTPDEEAEQARQMMEAQREKRKKAAQEKLHRLVNTEENSEVPSAPASTSEPLNTVSANPVSDSTLKEKEDPMAKIRAEWERERDVQEALKAGNVDEALNLVNETDN